MSHSNSTLAISGGRAKPPTVFLALLLDVILVVAFVAAGRGQHERAETIAGLWESAWPFLAGLAISWIIGMVWRRPMAPLRSGVVVWIGTVALGMGIRVLFTDGGAALAFIIVAAGIVGLLLVGWRLLTLLIRRLLQRSSHPLNMEK